jgi:hypothetical protein
MSQPTPHQQARDVMIHRALRLLHATLLTLSAEIPLETEGRTRVLDALASADAAILTLKELLGP